MKIKSLKIIAPLQALGIVAYITLVSVFIWKNRWWLETNQGVLGISFYLLLLSTSVLISALITLGYPAYLVWKKKDVNGALRLVIYTALWLVLFVVLSTIVFLIRL